MGVFDSIQKTQVPNLKPHKEGYLWLTMLIKYDLNGNAEIVRRFVKDAKDSDIKTLLKPKYVPKGPVIEKQKTTDEVSLF